MSTNVVIASTSLLLERSIRWRDAHLPDRSVLTSCSLCVSSLPRPVELALPQPAHDARDAPRQVTPVGAEGQVEHLGGPLLGLGGPQIGAVNRPVQLFVSG